MEFGDGDYSSTVLAWFVWVASGAWMKIYVTKAEIPNQTKKTEIMHACMQCHCC